MKVQIIATIALTILFASFTFAAEKAPQSENLPAMCETRKAEQIKKIDERIKLLQEKKACMQAASTHEALTACHEKFMSEMKQEGPMNKMKPEGPMHKMRPF